MNNLKRFFDELEEEALKLPPNLRRSQLGYLYEFFKNRDPERAARCFAHAYAIDGETNEKSRK